jgi:hypothetical protein
MYEALLRRPLDTPFILRKIQLALLVFRGGRVFLHCRGCLGHAFPRLAE